jgi:hypothetical protein
VLQLMSFGQERERAVATADDVSETEPERLIERCLKLLGASQRQRTNQIRASRKLSVASELLRLTQTIFKASAAN